MCAVPAVTMVHGMLLCVPLLMFALPHAHHMATHTHTHTHTHLAHSQGVGMLGGGDVFHTHAHIRMHTCKAHTCTHTHTHARTPHWIMML